MKLALTLSTIFICLLTYQSTFAQEETYETQELSLDNGTIDNQFEYVIQKSSGWRDERGRVYEVVRREWLISLKEHTLDSLKAVKEQLVTSESKLQNQIKEIESLKLSLGDTQSVLDATKQEKDSMSLFGMQLGKVGYNALMWSIIGILFALVLFFVFKFKNSNSITKSANFKLAELESEFEEHRRTALEREQKVRRQLQDEINKHKSAKKK